MGFPVRRSGLQAVAQTMRGVRRTALGGLASILPFESFRRRSRRSVSTTALSASWRHQPDRFRLENLEPRLLLAADPVAIAIPSGATDVTLQLIEDEVDGEVVVQLVNNDDGEVVSEADLDISGPTPTINVTGSSADEFLTIDSSLVTLGKGLTITYDAVSGDDTLAGPLFDVAWSISSTGQGTGSANDDGTVSTISFQNIDTIAGSDLADSLTHSTARQTYSVTDINSVNLDSMSFTGIEELIGQATDTLDYTNFGEGIVVDFGAGEGTGFEAISGFSNLTGTAFADVLTGSSGANVISGLAGDDTITGAGGADTIDGGDDTDTVVESQDADMTLVTNAGTPDSLTIGGIISTLDNVEEVSLTGGASANTIDASAFVGIVTIDGGAGADVLTGGSSDDVITGGEGADTIDGGGGTDTIVETRNADMDLDTLQLIIGAEGTDSLTSIEGAILTGGIDSNRIDASGFAAGGVTLDGGAGNDILVGTGLADTITGGRGSDDIDGGLGSDTLVEANLQRAVLKDDELEHDGDLNDVQLITISGGTFTLTYDGQTTAAIDISADAETVAAALAALSNLTGDEFTVSGVPGAWEISFFGNLGRTDVPQITAALSSAAIGSIVEGTTTEGRGNEVQTVTLTGASTGTFTLTLDGQETAAIDYDADAATVEDALEALSTIGLHNVSVSGTAGAWVVTFDEDLGLQDVNTLTFDDAGTDGTIGVAVTAPGGDADEVQTITLNDSGFKLNYDGQITSSLSLNATADDIRQALEALSNIDAREVYVDGLPGEWYVTFVGDVHNTNAATLVVADLAAGAGTATVTEETRGGGDAIQKVSLVGATGGTFDLTLGASTATIPFDATPAAMQALLEAAADIGTGNVLVSGSAGDWTVTFRDGLGRQAVATMGIDIAAATNASAGTVTPVEVGGTDEIQLITQTVAGTDGFFTLTFNGEETRAIAHDASIGEVQTELRLLESLGASDVYVTGTAGAYNIRFTGAAAALDHGGITVTPDATAGTFVVSEVRKGAPHTDNLTSIELADLSGGAGDDSLDASAFTGNVTLSGGIGNDVLLAGAGNDVLDGGRDNDILSGGLGDNTITGGQGDDQILHVDAIDGTGETITLTNTSLTVVAGATTHTSTISGIEKADITGDDNANVINASAFAGIDEGTRVSFLNSGNGLGAVQEEYDIMIILSDGSVAEVDLYLAVSLDDVIALIEDADDNLSAVVNGSGQLVISDVAGGAGNLTIRSLNGSSAGSVLGILGEGSGATLTGAALVAGSVTIRGKGGGDTITGSAGDDLLSGGAGANTIDGGLGFNTLTETGLSATVLADGARTNEVQTITRDSGVAEGTFRLHFGGETTQDIDWDAGVATVRSALEGMSFFEVGDISVTTVTNGWAVEFTGNYAGREVEALTLSTDFRAADPGVTETTKGTGSVDEVQTIALGANVVSGQFELTFDGETTDEIAYDADADTVRDALAALSNLRTDVISVTEVGSDWQVTFVGDLAKTDVANITVESDFGVPLRYNYGGSISTTTAGTSVATLTEGAVVSNLTNIATAELEGTSGNDSISAATFGFDVTLLSAGGTDTLTGGSGDDIFVLDVTGLTAGVDTVTIDPNGGDNEIQILDTDGLVTASDFGWVTFADADTAKLTLKNDNRLTVSSAVTNAGANIKLKADVIAVNANISTVGTNGGNLEMEGRKISVADGVVIDTRTNLGGTDGNLTIKATDGATFSPTLGFYNGEDLTASIDIGAATINAGTVTITTKIDSSSTLSVPENATFFEEFGFTVAETLVDFFENISLFVGIANTKLTSTIDIRDNASITASGNFTARSEGIAEAYSRPLSFLLGVAVGVINSTVTTTIAGDITANNGDVDIGATNKNISSVFADVGGVKGVAGAVAVSVINSTTTAEVTETANLTVGDDLFVTAENTDASLVKTRSVTGDNGVVGVAVSISVENNVTSAILDGTVRVADDITVVAKQNETSVDVLKLFIIPSTSSGVSASAGVGKNDTGDVLDDQTQRATGAIFAKLGGAFKSLIKKDVDSESKGTKDSSFNGFDFGAAVAIIDDKNTVTARIGDGSVTANRADIEAGGDINVVSNLQDRPKSSASSNVKNETGSNKTAEGKATSKAKFGGSISTIVGSYSNTARSLISGDANVDSKGRITLDSDAINKFDWTKIAGINIVTGAMKALESDYESSDGLISEIKQGDIVKVTGSHNAGGDQGSFYEYVGSPYNDDGGGAGVDLSQEDYTDTSRWSDLGNGALNAGLAVLSGITKMLNSTLGIKSVFDSWSQSRSEGQKLSLSGSVTVNFLDYNSRSKILNGALVNQEDLDSNAVSNRTGNQHVELSADTINHNVNLIGQIKTPGLESDNRPGTWKLEAKPFDKGKFIDVGVKDSDKAIGIAVGIYYMRGEASAIIEDGVTLDADSLEVDADNETIGVTLGASGGSSKKFAFNGVGIGFTVENDTTAQIAEGATVNIGSGSVSDSDGGSRSVFVDANDNTYLATFAGSVATGEATGIGASVAVNIVDRDTEALIGRQRDDNTAAATGGSFTSAGDVLLRAKNDGVDIALSIAGAKIAPAKKTDQSSKDSGTGGNTDSDIDDYWNTASKDGPNFSSSGDSSGTQPTENTGKTGVGFSGAVAINLSRDDARAYLLDTGVVNTGALELEAKNLGDKVAVGGAASYVRTENATDKAFAIAGAAGVNRLNGATEALIDGSTSFTVSSLDFDAFTDHVIVTVGVGASGATGKKGIALAGSAAVYINKESVTTAIRNVAGTSTVSGTTDLLAEAGGVSVLVAGAAGFGGKAGVGLGAAVADVGQTVTSEIDNVTTLNHTGTVNVKARADGTLIGVAAAVGVGSGGGGGSGYGVAGTFAMNNVTSNITAEIKDSTVAGAGAVAVDAEDDSFYFTFSGGFAAGKTLGLGVGVALNLIQTTVTARTDGATISGTSSIRVRGQSLSDLLTIGVGAAGSKKVGLAGGFAVNSTKATTVAEVIDSSALTASGAITVQANDTNTLISISAAGAGAKNLAIGAGVGVNLTDNTTRATVDNSNVRSTGSTVSVVGLTDNDIIAVAVGGAGAQNVAIGGSIVVNQIDNSTTSEVKGNADIQANGAAAVTANDNSSIIVVAGAGAGAKDAGIGAAVATAEIDNTITATVTGTNTEVTSDTSTVDVAASFGPPTTAADLSGLGIDTSSLPSDTQTDSQIINVTVAGAGANTFAAGAAISLNWLRNTIEASVTGGANVSAPGKVSITAADDADIISVAVGASGAATTAVGAAISYNYIGGDPGDPSRNVDENRDATDKGSIIAKVDGAGTTVSSTANEVAIEATSEAQIINVTIGGSGAGTVAVSGSISINFMKHDVDAVVSGGASVTGQTSVGVGASVKPLMIIVAGAGSGAGTTAVGAAVATNDIRSDIDAYVTGTNTQVTATTGNVAITAEVLERNQADLDAQNISLQQDGDPGTNNIVDAQIWAFAVSGTGAGTVGVAGSLTLNWIRSTVSAEILDSATVGASAGTVFVKAKDAATLNSVAGGFSGAGTAAIGAAVAYNWIGGDPDNPVAATSNAIQATVDNATVNADQLSVDAESVGVINTIAVSISGSGTFAGNGSLALNFIRKDVESEVRNNADINATGDVAIDADDTSTINSLATQINGSGAVAIGAAVAYNEIKNEIGARVLSGADIDVTTGNSGNITVDANSASTITSIGAGISGSGSVGVAGSAVSNLIENTTEAKVAGASTVLRTDDSIRVNAVDVTDPAGYAGTIAGGGVAGVGGTVVVNQVTNTTNALINDDATITALGTATGGVAVMDYDTSAASGVAGSTENIRGLVVNASSTIEDQQNTVEADVIAVSGALGIGGAGVGLNAAVNIVKGSTTAGIDDATVNSSSAKGQDVRVRAHHYLDFTSGGGAIGGGSVGVGATVDTNISNHTTTAYIKDVDPTETDNIYAGGTVEVFAISREALTSVTVGAGIGLYAGVAGSGVGYKNNSDTKAYIEDMTVAADVDVIVQANAAVNATFGAGALGGGIGGVGGGVVVALFERDVEAYINDADIDARDVKVDADDTEEMNTSVATGAVGGTAVAGAVHVAETKTEVKAYIGDAILDAGFPTDVTATRDIEVTADGTTKINQASSAFVGSGAIGGGGAGASVEVITVKTAVLASIGATVKASSGRHTKVDSNAQRNVDSQVIALAGGAVFGVSGAVSVISIGSGMETTGFGQVSASQGAIDGIFTGSLDGMSGGDGTNQRAQAAADANLFTYQLATDSSGTVGDITAQIAEGSTVTAGTSDSAGDILVEATEGINLESITGGAAIGGFAGIGGSVAVVTLKSATVAVVEDSATLSAADDVTIKAESDYDTSVNAYGGGAGAVGLGAQVAIINDSATTRAFMADGANAASAAKITAADAVSIDADSIRDHDTDSVGAQAGGVAAGAAIGRVTMNGSTQAYIGAYGQIGGVDATNPGVTSVTVSADDTVDIKSNAVSVAAGIGAGAGNDVTIDYSGTLKAYSDADTQILASGAVALSATTKPKIESDMVGVSAGGLAVGVSKTDIEIDPDAVVSLGDPDDSTSGDVNIDAGSLSLTSTVGLPTSGSNIDAYSQGASGALVGIDATVTYLDNNSDVKSFVADGSTITVDSTASIAANNAAKIKGESNSNVGGIVAAGASAAHSNSNVTTKAYLGANVAVTGAELAIGATTATDNFADVNSGNGGVIAGAGAETRTNATSVTTAEIQGVTSGTPKIDLTSGDGELSITASNTSKFNQKAGTVAGGVVSGTGASMEAEITADTTASIGDGVSIDAYDVAVQATNKADKPNLGYDNFDGTSGGLIAGGGATSRTWINFDTIAQVVGDVVIDVDEGGTNDGDFSINANNILNVKDTITLTAGGAVAGAGTESVIIAGGSDYKSKSSKLLAKVEIGAGADGAGADIQTEGDFIAGAHASGLADAKVNTDTYGVGTVGVSDTRTQIHPENVVTISDDADILALGNVELTAGITSRFVRDLWKVKAYTDSLAGSAIPIDNVDARAELFQTNTINVNTGATIKTGSDILLYVEKDGFAEELIGRAKSTNWTTALAGAINGDGVAYNGNSEAKSTGTVNVNGTLETGIGRNKTIVFNDFNWDTSLGAVSVSGTIDGAPVTVAVGDAAAADEFGYTVTLERFSTKLIEELNAAKAELANFLPSDATSDNPGTIALSPNPTLYQFWLDEVDRYQQLINALGLTVYEDDGITVREGVIDEKYFIKITMDDLFASAGEVRAFGDDFLGSGSVSTPRDVVVSITNNTPATLELNDIEIPSTKNGGLYWNTSEVTSTSEIAALNASGQTPGFTAVPGAPDPLLDDPLIDIRTDIDETNANYQAGIAANGPSAFPEPAIIVVGSLENLAGTLRIINDEGDIELTETGDFDAKDLEIIASGTVTIRGTFVDADGEAFSKFEDALGFDGTSNATTLTGVTQSSIETLLSQSAGSNPDIVAQNISILGEYINVNGVIQGWTSGHQHHDRCSDPRRDCTDPEQQVRAC